MTGSGSEMTSQEMEALMREMIDLLKKVLENSGSARASEQIDELIRGLHAVERQMKYTVNALQKVTAPETELSMIKSHLELQNRQIKEIHGGLNWLLGNLGGVDDRDE